MFHYKTRTFNFFCIGKDLFANFNSFSGGTFVGYNCVNEDVAFWVEKVSIHLINPFNTKFFFLFWSRIDIMQFFKLLDPVELIGVAIVGVRHVVVGVLI